VVSDDRRRQSEFSALEQADADAEKRDDQQARQAFGAMPGRHPYSAEAVG